MVFTNLSFGSKSPPRIELAMPLVNLNNADIGDQVI